MSMILKGIDLPRERETLKLVIFPQGAVVRHKEDEIWETGEEYQAIQIPRDHGVIADMKTFKVDVVDVSTSMVSWTVNQILGAEEE